MRAGALLVGLVLLDGCQAETALKADPGRASSQSPAGLVPLPCDGSEPMGPAHPFYCSRDRVYVRPEARAAMVEAAREMARRFPGTRLIFMDASGPDGIVPFEPHLSHGDGRQVDVSLFYSALDGRPIHGPPPGSRRNGYGNYEPPRPGDPQPCRGIDRPNDDQDPPADRAWRLDDARSRALTELFAADPRVRRILIEPHLEHRWNLDGESKLRFAGCQAARHDDHLHIDFN
ncbi:hypothetical protein [Brevundimonas aveniformis]|uniref:hypothetical protein n=1 Tax=Brevundimonas aveniformis TaxID=370977 RepID=UPI002490AEAF|nr:hypothetical protein [Brevundimonas aveniformis]